MKYELAFKLKEAGFPHKCVVNTGNDYCSQDFEFPQGNICFPTLSELIEACGNGKGFTISRDIYGIWRTEIEKETETEWGIVYSCGETVTESVANLWIALNKK